MNKQWLLKMFQFALVLLSFSATTQASDIRVSGTTPAWIHHQVGVGRVYVRMEGLDGISKSCTGVYFEHSLERLSETFVYASATRTSVSVWYDVESVVTLTPEPVSRGGSWCRLIEVTVNY